MQPVVQYVAFDEGNETAILEITKKMQEGGYWDDWLVDTPQEAAQLGKDYQTRVWLVIDRVPQWPLGPAEDFLK